MMGITRQWWTALAVAIAALTFVDGAQAKPVKEIVASHIGWKVDRSTGGNLCTVESGDECQAGLSSSMPGGFEHPHAIAVDNDPSSPAYGDVYVADSNARIQVLSPDGEFLRMFGWEVNETKDTLVGATQQEKNICTAESGDACKVGVRGAAPGHIDGVLGIAVDPASGTLYVAESVPTGESYGDRLQAMSSDGRFILEVGQEVNATTGANICTAAEEAEGIECAGPARFPAKKYKNTEIAYSGTTEHDAFSFEGGKMMLTIGGPEDLVYVGEQERVQELHTDGTFKREVPLGFISSLPGNGVNYLAVNTAGDLYLFYNVMYVEVPGEERLDNNQDEQKTIYHFDDGGTLVGELEPMPRQSEGKIQIAGLAFDPSGRLAVLEDEEFRTTNTIVGRAGLYDVGAGRLHLISEFNPGREAYLYGGSSINDLTFSDDGRMYATQEAYQAEEVVEYTPVTIGELSARPVTCSQGAETETDVSLACSLHGEVNPWGVSNTEAWFEWGYAALSNTTAGQQITTGETPVTVVSAPIGGLLPNAVVHYRLAGHDQPVQPPEELESETLTAKLPKVPPRVLGSPQAQFVGPSSADMYSLLNPENANTEYFFEYSPGLQSLSEKCPNGLAKESCESVVRTRASQSSAYGAIGATFEASGLQPGTTYRFRLMAVNDGAETAANENGGAALPEGQFTTLSAPAPRATTGTATAGSTSASVSGAVDSNGEPSVYSFELGVYDPAETQYVSVLSASAGSQVGPVQETANLSALQPGTTYAFRVAITNAFGTSHGAPVLFTTQGLSAVIAVPIALPHLDIPAIAFPATGKASVRSKCKRGQIRKNGRCMKKQAKRRSGKRKRKSARKADEHAAHKAVRHSWNAKGGSHSRSS
jgi:hypothetical protein